MKKYLILFILLLIYIYISNNKTEYVFSNRNYDNKIIDKIDISFDNGINSNKLINIMNDFDSNYYIESINIYNKEYDVKCSNIGDCINELYNLFDNNFYNKYITTGFKIDKVRLIADKNKLINLLNDEDIIFDY